MSQWHLYIIKCADNSLYTGITTDVARRFNQHSNNQGAKRTKGRGPLNLCYQAKVGNKSTALRLEYAVKKLAKQDKLNLIDGNLVLESLID